jgi:multiple sugar transport system substrate-binding protein
MRAAQGNAAVADFMPVFWAFGAEMFEATGKPTVNNAEGVAALIYVELRQIFSSGLREFQCRRGWRSFTPGHCGDVINWPA